MKKFKDVQFSLRVVTGVLIAAHGLLRIVFMHKYIDFVLINFSDILKTETLLIIGASILPFLEFFTGLLILFKVALRKSLMSGFLISVIMVVFILIGDLYARLIYHVIIFGLLFLIKDRHNNLKARRLI